MCSPEGFPLYLPTGEAINLEHFMDNMTDKLRVPVDRPLGGLQGMGNNLVCPVI